MTDTNIGRPRKTEPVVSASSVLPVARIEVESSKPVKVWAWVGVFCIAVQVFIYARWVTGPRFKRVPSGPSDPPMAMKVTLVVYTVLGFVAMGLFLYWFVFRKWRRDRTVGIEGLMCVAWLLTYWQDPLADYGGLLFTYNSWLPNRGSWANEFPGWLPPGEPGRMLVEPFNVAPAYIYGFLGLSLLGAWIMRRAKARWPSMSKPRLIGFCFAVFVLVDIPVESLWTRMGWYVWAGAPGPTLFRGHYYQLPIFEVFLAGLFFTATSCFVYFRDDRGQTMMERGIDSLRASPKQKLAIRLLAATAATNVALLFFYSVPAIMLSLHAHEWPADVQKRSYFTNFLCGEGTTTSCPADSLPLFKEGSARISPDGTLVVPEGVRLPRAVPFDRGPLGGNN